MGQEAFRRVLKNAVLQTTGSHIGLQKQKSPPPTPFNVPRTPLLMHSLVVPSSYGGQRDVFAKQETQHGVEAAPVADVRPALRKAKKVRPHLQEALFQCTINKLC